MSGLLDSDGGLFTGLCGVVQPWDQAESIEIFQGRKITELDKSGKEVHEADCFRAALTGFAFSGGADK